LTSVDRGSTKILPQSREGFVQKGKNSNPANRAMPLKNDHPNGLVAHINRRKIDTPVFNMPTETMGDTNPPIIPEVLSAGLA
jgi:hypothetical protein